MVPFSTRRSPSLFVAGPQALTMRPWWNPTPPLRSPETRVSVPVRAPRWMNCSASATETSWRLPEKLISICSGPSARPRQNWLRPGRARRGSRASSSLHRSAARPRRAPIVLQGDLLGLQVSRMHDELIPERDEPHRVVRAATLLPVLRRDGAGNEELSRAHLLRPPIAELVLDVVLLAQLSGVERRALVQAPLHHAERLLVVALLRRARVGGRWRGRSRGRRASPRCRDTGLRLALLEAGGSLLGKRLQLVAEDEKAEREVLRFVGEIELLDRADVILRRNAHAKHRLVTLLAVRIEVDQLLRRRGGLLQIAAALREGLGEPAQRELVGGVPGERVMKGGDG